MKVKFSPIPLSCQTILAFPFCRWVAMLAILEFLSASNPGCRHSGFSLLLILHIHLSVLIQCLTSFSNFRLVNTHLPCVHHSSSSLSVPTSKSFMLSLSLLFVWLLLTNTWTPWFSRFFLLTVGKGLNFGCLDASRSHRRISCPLAYF